MDNLKNKVVLITGSSIGIGREDAFKFAKEGCKLVITYYKDKNEALSVAKKCLDLGAADVLVLQLDVADGKSVKKCIDDVIKKFKEISILINNAGVIIWKHFAKQNDEEIESQIRTNLIGILRMTKECLPYVKDIIINMGSGAALDGYADLSVYCATKFGVRGFSQALAQELKHVKIFVVNPGVIATRMNDFHGMPPEKVAEVILNVAKGKYKLESGSDVNIWDYA